MDDRGTQALMALAWMADQYLADADGMLGKLAMSLGELAMEVLAEHGLVKLENSRIGRWTEAGRSFLNAN